MVADNHYCAPFCLSFESLVSVTSYCIHALWKVQMRHQLRSKKLWKLVRGEETLAEGAEQNVVNAFEERSIDATMRLTHAMTPPVVLLVQSLDCPVKIWNKLERQYEKRTAGLKLSLV